MSYELHVLEGEQQGACTTLPEGMAFSVSGDLDSDVVLRGAGVAGQRITLQAEGQTLHLRVLQGQAEVDGRPLAAGQALATALSTPVRLGGTCIVVQRAATGAHGEGHADEHSAGTDNPDLPAADADAAASAARPGRAGAHVSAHGNAQTRAHTWARRVAGAGVALASVSMAVLAFAYSLAPRPPTPEQQAHRAQALLQGAGLQGLSVALASNGELRIDGYLESGAQRARAEQLLADEGLGARWQVFVNEQVAGAVQDVFRTHGVAARVQAVGPGAVRVATQVADPRVLETIRSHARRDVPGLAVLDLSNDIPPATIGPTPTMEDPGKRVASIVPGELPYVVTADGTRYFEGALLPTGHRIAGIEEHRVVLEMNGVQTPLLF